MHNQKNACEIVTPRAKKCVKRHDEYYDIISKKHRNIGVFLIHSMYDNAENV